MKSKIKLCWYCAKVAKCEILEPCDKFERYCYSFYRNVSIRKIANKLSISHPALSYRLKQKTKETLNLIEEKLGLRLVCVKAGDGKITLVERSEK